MLGQGTLHAFTRFVGFEGGEQVVAARVQALDALVILETGRLLQAGLVAPSWQSKSRGAGNADRKHLHQQQYLLTQS